jgi:chaperonin GroES
MSTPLQPLADYVVAVAEEAETKTASGILLPESAKEKPAYAKVVAVGKGATEIKVGDRIIYKNYSSTDIKVGSDNYIVVKEEDIIAKVK